MKWTLRHLPLSFTFSFVCCAGLGCQLRCEAQAVPTAGRTADIAAFGGFTYANPTYGPDYISGGMFGVDFTRYFHIPVQPSLEFRANFIAGNYVRQHTYLAGLRVAKPFGAIKPYADFLVGPGTIYFPYNLGYPQDNSTVYSYGGGVDIGVARNFSLKLDVQGQHWNTGTLTYTPTLGTVGVLYTIPFRPHESHRDFGR